MSLSKQELPEIECLVGFGSSMSVVHHGFPQDLKNANDIHELQMQLEQKDQQITELNEKVKELDNKNNDLVIELKAKDKEVKKLKERIHKLEDEKKVLQEELASVKSKLKTIENEVSELNKSMESQEEKSIEIEEDLAKIKFTLKSVEQDLKSTKKENESLKKQVKEVRNTSARYVAGAPLRLPVQADDQSKALSCIEELFCQILTAMYRLVLPEFFTPIIRYTLDAIENDAKKLPHTEEERQEATERLEKLKKELHWNEDFDEILESLPHSRTLDTHRPGLDEKLLRKATEDLEKEGILKGWLSLDRINNLIELWKRLQCKQ